MTDRDGDADGLPNSPDEGVPDGVPDHGDPESDEWLWGLGIAPIDDTLSSAPADEPHPEMDDLLEDLQDIEELVDDPNERQAVRNALITAVRVRPTSVFGRVVKGYGTADVAESLLGAFIFGVPMLVEGGTLEIGSFLAGHPGAVAATLAFTVAVVIGVLYVTDIQDVRVVDPILGVIPRRLVGVLGVAFLFAVTSMTLWGRVDWATPWLAFSQVTVAFVPMAVGAALGDILPGT